MIDLYAPIVIALALAMLALSGLPQLFATYREKGILRRLATTPVRPAVAARRAAADVHRDGRRSSCWSSLAIGRFAFDVTLPLQVAGFLLAFVLGVLAMLAIGLLVAALAPSGEGAGAIGSLLFFPMLFFAGLWAPREIMSAALRRISDFTPLGAGVQSLSDAAAGHWPQLLHVAVMLRLDGRGGRAGRAVLPLGVGGGRDRGGAG